MKINILVIGSGGREHALVWKLKQSSLAGNIYSAPANGGISLDAEAVALQHEDFRSIEKFVDEKSVGLIVVGPEMPLAAGIKDYFNEKNVIVYGPGREGAKLESSKIFAKKFMEKQKIPTAPYKTFTDPSAASEYLSFKENVAIKADGLCGGKGVFLPGNSCEAVKAVKDIMIDGAMGDAGSKILIEDKLEGEEISLLVMICGENYTLLLPARDHKAAFDGDRGPNTGGMGAYAPVSGIKEKLIQKIETKIVVPAIEGLLSRNIHYEGILYLGLMIVESEPYVLEFNVRFGDPEAQALLPLMKSDLIETILSLREGKNVKVSWKKGCCVDIVLASGGYPAKYQTALPMEIKESSEDIMLFHSGTIKEENKFFTAGGRVINIAAVGKDIEQAREKVYGAAKNIYFQNMYYRKDIGLKEVKI